MAWCRRIDPVQDLYIFASVVEHWECHQCLLDAPRYQHFKAYTAEAMAQHIADHVAAGHQVPAYYNPETIVAELNGEMDPVLPPE